MADYAYQAKKGKELRTARARITGVNASYKDLCNVCANVRGKDTEHALEFLNEAAEMKRAIHFARHNTGKGHRRELGGRKGGWPVKSVKIVLGVLQNAVANANKLGLSGTKLAHIIANKQDTYPRMSPKGRRIVHNYETAFVEIVLEEVQEKSGTIKEGGAKIGKKGGEEKKAAKAGANKKPEAAKPAGIKAAPAPKAADAQKTEEQAKRQEMSSTDKHRPIENRKLDAVHKEEQRI